MLRIKLVRGIHGQKPRNRATLAALGFRKTGHVVFHEDNAVIRGMIQHVAFALEVTEVSAEEAQAAKAPKQAKAPAVTAPKAEAKAAPKAKATKAKVEETPAEAKPKRTTKKKEAEA